MSITEYQWLLYVLHEKNLKIPIEAVMWDCRETAHILERKENGQKQVHIATWKKKIALVTRQVIKYKMRCAPAKPKPAIKSQILAGKGGSSICYFHRADEVQGEWWRWQKGGEHHKANASLRHTTGSRKDTHAALEWTCTNSLKGDDWYWWLYCEGVEDHGGPLLRSLRRSQVFHSPEPSICSWERDEGSN